MGCTHSSDRADATVKPIEDPKPAITLLDFDWPPPSPREILEDKAKYEQLLNRRARFPKARPDTPGDCLYRLYEHLLLDHRFGIRNEIEYFWWEAEWAVHEIPDPQDPDPIRYAVLACIPHLFVRAFNYNLERGLHRDVAPILSDQEREELKGRESKLESVPHWAAQVPPAPEIVTIPHEDGEVLGGFEDKRCDPDCAKYNVLVWTPHILFV